MKIRKFPKQNTPIEYANLKVDEVKIFSVVVVYTILAGRNAQSPVQFKVIYLISLTPHCSQVATFCFVHSFSSLSGPGNDENVMSSLQSISREWNAFDPRSTVIENKNQGDTYLLKIDRVTGDIGIVSHNVRKTMWYPSS